MPRAGLSFEYFPPQSPAGIDRLCEVHNRLCKLNPEFVSVTYGAGGSTRARTREVVFRLGEVAGVDVAPHLSFGADDADLIESMLDEYRDRGIQRLVVLRGDMPSGLGSTSQLPHASDLVGLVRAHSGKHFHLAVACYPEMHPQAESFDSDVGYLKQKLEAGADRAITQYFYNSDAYFQFVDYCATNGIDKPIYPGIMPIGNYRNLARFSRNCGAEIPRWLHQRIESMGDNPDAVVDFGIDVVSRLCEKLLAGGAPGIHFYTMNGATATTRICENIGLH